jgi:hypothetical protein
MCARRRSAKAENNMRRQQHRERRVPRRRTSRPATAAASRDRETRRVNESEMNRQAAAATRKRMPISAAVTAAAIEVKMTKTMRKSVRRRIIAHHTPLDTTARVNTNARRSKCVIGLQISRLSRHFARNPYTVHHRSTHSPIASSPSDTLSRASGVPALSRLVRCDWLCMWSRRMTVRVRDWWRHRPPDLHASSQWPGHERCAHQSETNANAINRRINANSSLVTA